MSAWRRNLLVADTVLALLVAATFVIAVLVSGEAVQDPVDSAFTRYWGLFLLQTLPLVLRRSRPLGVLAVTRGAEIVSLLTGPGVTVGGVTIALYTVAAHRDRRTAVRAGLAASVALAVAITIVEGFDPVATVTQILFRLQLDAASWMFGAYVRELRARSSRLEQDREHQTRRAVAEEQARIARELHDVIAHNVSVMVVQAAAARDVFELQPARAQEALGAIEATGREAMTELRRLLGAVRPDGREGEVPGEIQAKVPQPSLDRLDGLIEQVRAAGLPVELRIDGKPSALPPGMELSAYRIIQEALTNTLRHAHASHAAVTVRYGVHDLVVEVYDDGLGDTGHGSPSGRGLIGMRERAALFNGSLDARAREGGGFAVRARLPLLQER
ncbi:MAG: sensor histidine kinase [Egibacteraceae bacterium]